VSGLHFPRLPSALWRQPFPVAMTAPCSLQVTDADLQLARRNGRVSVVSSAAGFEHWPTPRVRPVSLREPRLGYLGSLNLPKMHPAYVDWLAAARHPGLSVELLGDESNSAWLKERCNAWLQPRMLRPRGYCHDVPRALSRWDLLVYLLNPYHYGTAEIALLEAMASEVVPIVANNPCELDVVQHGTTGWVVHDAESLSTVLSRCRRDPLERQLMGRQASAWVRERFTLQRLADGFSRIHEQSLALPRQTIDWVALVGEQPWQWFLSTVPADGMFVPGGSVTLPDGAARWAHLEPTKGSVHHFARHFEHDEQLRIWSQAVLAELEKPQDLQRAA